MKTKPTILLIIGLGAWCTAMFAQEKTAQDANVQKLYNQSAGTPAAIEASTPAAPGDTVEVLPIVQFEEAPLVDVIKTMARQASLNVLFEPKVLAPGPDGKPVYPTVSLRLENVTAQSVLEAVLANNGLRLEKDPKTKISRVTIRDPQSTEPLSTKVYQLRYTNPSNLVAILRPTITQRSQVIPDGRTSQLVVLATEKEIAEMDSLIERLDKATMQVLIEARLYETTRNPSTLKGINWSATASHQTFSFGNNVNGGNREVTLTGEGGNSQTINQTLPTSGPLLLMDTAKGFNPSTAFLDADGVKGVISFFNEDNETEVLATPKTVTMDNQPSRIEVTKALPIFKVTTGGTQSGPTVDITYTNIGVILTVTPRISANSNIAMKIMPEVSTVEEKRDVQVVAGLSNTANVYAIRRIETQVMVPSGNTLVLGGLINDVLGNSKTKVPILGDLPIVGYAFRSSAKTRQKKNLVIFITPSVVADGDYTPSPSTFLKTPVVHDNQLDEKADQMFKGALNSTDPHDWSKPVY